MWGSRGVVRLGELGLGRRLGASPSLRIRFFPSRSFSQSSPPASASALSSPDVSIPAELTREATSGPLASPDAIVASVAPPTREQLRILAIYSMVPMIAFGFMDNTIMIQAGDLIDSTMGHSLKLPTLAAAASGQLASDFSGVMFGGTVEAILTKYFGLRIPTISPEQLEMKKVRIIKTLFAALGVALGCALGMSQMLFMDLKKNERLKREKDLAEMFSEVTARAAATFAATALDLYFYDPETNQVSQGNFSKTHSAAPAAGTDSSQVSSDPAFEFTSDILAASVDAKHAIIVNRGLVAPIRGEDGKVQAFIVISGKTHDTNFTGADVRMATMLSNHVALLMKMQEDDD